MKNRRHFYLLTRVFTVGILFFSVLDLKSESVDWVGGTGLWFLNTNWSNGSIQYVPNSGSDAAIGNNGIASITDSGTAFANVLKVGVVSKGTLNINSAGKLTSASGEIGSAAGGDGAVVLNGSGSTWTNSGQLQVGIGGKGYLEITAGAKVSNTLGKVGVGGAGRGDVSVSGLGSTWTNAGDLILSDWGTSTLGVYTGATVSNVSAFLGYESTGTASATVSDGSLWTSSSDLFVGFKGSGQLSVTTGGQVSSTNGTIGHSNTTRTSSVTVDGVGSLWNSTASLFVGMAGKGDLSITTNGAVSSQDAYVGFEATGDGRVTVDKVGSAWTSRGQLHVGHGGNGWLEVKNGAKVRSVYGGVGVLSTGDGDVSVTGGGSEWINSADLVVGDAGTGTLDITLAGAVSASSGYIGKDTTGHGTVTINGVGSEWTNSQSLFVGHSGAALLEISGGGKATSASGFIGYDNGTRSAKATITGEGSIWTNTGSLQIGHLGTGVLEITGKGLVSNTTGIIGDGATGHGTVTVSGAGSLWTNTLDLNVGESGRGFLNIFGAGKVTNAYANIGHQAAGEGSVSVQGAGSTWEIANNLSVGSSGQGSLEIGAGSTVTAATSFIGHEESGVGEVTVSGNGTTWTNTGDLHVGYSGKGTFDMTGGKTSDLTGYLGYNETGVGTATIFSGTWRNSTALYVGYEGKGTLNLTGDGVVEVGASGTGTLTLANAAGSVGTLNIGAGDTVGTLLASSVHGGAGQARVNFNHAGVVTFDPFLTGSLSVSKSGSGTLRLTKANSYTGDTEVNDGKLEVSNTTGSATGLGTVIVGTLGTLEGTGLIAGPVEVNGTVSPGIGGVGSLGTGSQTWNSGGTYLWEIANAIGGKGTDWDWIAVTGDLTISSTLDNPFVISLVTLDLVGFDSLTSYAWTIVTVTGTIAAFTADQYHLDLGGFEPSYEGAFSLVQDGQNLNIVYAVPEPATWLLLAAGLLVTMVRFRRKLG